MTRLMWTGRSCARIAFRTFIQENKLDDMIRKQVHLLNLAREDNPSLSASQVFADIWEDAGEMSTDDSSNHEESTGNMFINEPSSIFVYPTPKRRSSLPLKKSKSCKNTSRRRASMDNGDPLIYPHACPKCPKRFKVLKSMMIHEKTHSEKKAFECPLCKKEFSWNGSLSRHHRIHTGEKPYQCNICQKRFTQSGTLNRHVRTHDSNELECQVCGQTFTKASEIHEHISIHFPNGVSPTNGLLLSVADSPQVLPQGQHVLLGSEMMEVYADEDEEEEEDDDTMSIDFDQAAPPNAPLELAQEPAPVSSNSNERGDYCKGQEEYSKDQEEYRCNWCGCAWSSHEALLDHFMVHLDEQHVC